MTDWMGAHSALELFLFALTNIAGSAFTGAMGVGGGLFFTGVLTWFVPMSLLVPVQNLCFLPSSLFRSWLIRTDIQWRLLPPFMGGLALGSFAAGYVYLSIPENWLRIVLGTTMLILAFKPKREGGHLHRLGRTAAGRFGASVVHGVLSTLTGVGGLLPALFPHLHLNKRQMVSTLTMVHLSNNVCRFIALSPLLPATQPYWPLVAVGVPFAMLGGWLGHKFFDRIPEHVFMPLYRAVIVFSAGRILWEAFA